jgi:hypothetical protein
MARRLRSAFYRSGGGIILTGCPSATKVAPVTITGSLTFTPSVTAIGFMS